MDTRSRAVTKPLRMLIVEDCEPDAKLIVRELVSGGYEPDWRRVEGAEQMDAALEHESWDLVISDWSMPRFSALEAYHLLRCRELDIPFIIVSGTVGEEVAVEALKAGASDFILKDKLGRLLPAVERELREAASRQESRRLQQYVLMSDRLASVGTLAAGVAHEVNNPLAFIIGNIDFVLRLLQQLATAAELRPKLSESIAALEDAHKGTERIREIMRGLRLFARGDDDRHGPVDVTAVLESSISVAWNEIKHRAKLVRDYGPLLTVQASEGRLGQVFLNLLINAAQAIPEGQAEQNEIRVAAHRRNGDVIVKIADTGVGIPPEHRARLFKPFFTTKPPGSGTGLGLSICYGIIKGMGGDIGVESQPGKGTCFSVRFPVGALAVASAPPPLVLPSTTVGRRCRVLVIDDEEEILRVYQRCLEGEHDVAIAASGEEALGRLRGETQFDVILCDLMMPSMDGIAFHGELQKLTPALASRIVFITGGAFTQRARDFLAAVPNHRLEKPFGPDELRAAIRSAVGGM